MSTPLSCQPVGWLIVIKTKRNNPLLRLIRHQVASLSFTYFSHIFCCLLIVEKRFKFFPSSCRHFFVNYDMLAVIVFQGLATVLCFLYKLAFRCKKRQIFSCSVIPFFFQISVNIKHFNFSTSKNSTRLSVSDILQ